jgi:hypothetical protein
MHGCEVILVEERIIALRIVARFKNLFRLQMILIKMDKCAIPSSGITSVTYLSFHCAVYLLNSF